MSNTNSDNSMAPIDWFSCYSYSYTFATDYANRITKKFRTYITAIRVSEENSPSATHVIGEWMLTSKYDPRIAERK